MASATLPVNSDRKHITCFLTGSVPHNWEKKKKKLSVMLLSFTFSFFFFFFFFNYCLIKLPHKPQILLCLIFFIFLLRPSYATPGKILFLGKLCSAFLAARRLQLPPRAVLFCFLMYRSCRKHHPTGSRNKSPFNRLSQLLWLRRVPGPCDHHVCCSPRGHFSNHKW